MKHTTTSIDRLRIYKRIHTCLRLAEISEHKQTLVASVCGQRTDSMKELSDGELLQLQTIVEVETARKIQPTRNHIIHKLCLLGMVIGDKADYAKINAWCLTRTAAKKELNRQSYSELRATASEVDAWYKKEIKR